MLEQGIKVFNELEKEVTTNGGDQVYGGDQVNGGDQVSGDKTFFMYDTLGFPVDLTELMAQEASMTVDTKGFTNQMEAQKNRSRKTQSDAKSGAGAPTLEFIAKQTAALTEKGVLVTDDAYKYKWDVELPVTIMVVCVPDSSFKD